MVTTLLLKIEYDEKRIQQAEDYLENLWSNAFVSSEHA